MITAEDGADRGGQWGPELAMTASAGMTVPFERRVVMYWFNHFNFNVLDLDRSLAFYKEALGLEPVEWKRREDFTIVYLGDGRTGFRLELTWLHDRKEPYDLGEIEYHLAMTAPDFQAAHSRHEQMGIICFENPDMGIYFIEDPDGYWIEIVPER